MAARMIAQLKPTFGVDLIVKTNREISQRITRDDFFLKQAMREGNILYEAPHA